jgi:hypothetical protein
MKHPSRVSYFAVKQTSNGTLSPGELSDFFWFSYIS